MEYKEQKGIANIVKLIADYLIENRLILIDFEHSIESELDKIVLKYKNPNLSNENKCMF